MPEDKPYYEAIRKAMSDAADDSVEQNKIKASIIAELNRKEKGIAKYSVRLTAQLLEDLDWKTDVKPTDIKPIVKKAHTDVFDRKKIEDVVKAAKNTREKTVLAKKTPPPPPLPAKSDPEIIFPQPKASSNAPQIDPFGKNFASVPEDFEWPPIVAEPKSAASDAPNLATENPFSAALAAETKALANYYYDSIIDKIKGGSDEQERKFILSKIVGGLKALEKSDNGDFASELLNKIIDSSGKHSTDIQNALISVQTTLVKFHLQPEKQPPNSPVNKVMQDLFSGVEAELKQLTKAVFSTPKLSKRCEKKPSTAQPSITPVMPAREPILPEVLKPADGLISPVLKTTANQTERPIFIRENTPIAPLTAPRAPAAPPVEPEKPQSLAAATQNRAQQPQEAVKTPAIELKVERPPASTTLGLQSTSTQTTVSKVIESKPVQTQPVPTPIATSASSIAGQSSSVKGPNADAATAKPVAKPPQEPLTQPVTSVKPVQPQPEQPKPMAAPPKVDSGSSPDQPERLSHALKPQKANKGKRPTHKDFVPLETLKVQASAATTTPVSSKELPPQPLKALVPQSLAPVKSPAAPQSISQVPQGEKETLGGLEVFVFSSKNAFSTYKSSLQKRWGYFPKRKAQLKKLQNALKLLEERPNDPGFLTAFLKACNDVENDIKGKSPLKNIVENIRQEMEGMKKEMVEMEQLVSTKTKEVSMNAIGSQLLIFRADQLNAYDEQLKKSGQNTFSNQLQGALSDLSKTLDLADYDIVKLGTIENVRHLNRFLMRVQKVQAEIPSNQENSKLIGVIESMIKGVTGVMADIKAEMSPPAVSQIVPAAKAQVAQQSPVSLGLQKGQKMLEQMDANLAQYKSSGMWPSESEPVSAMSKKATPNEEETRILGELVLMKATYVNGEGGDKPSKGYPLFQFKAKNKESEQKRRRDETEGFGGILMRITKSYSNGAEIKKIIDELQRAEGKVDIKRPELKALYNSSIAKLQELPAFKALPPTSSSFSSNP